MKIYRGKVDFMSDIKIPYGNEELQINIKEERFLGCMVSKIEDYKPLKSEWELVKDSLENPIETDRLCDLAKGKQKIVIIASDHTRPVPSKLIAPLMLKEIRKGNPDAEITFLISTGCHRNTTEDELISKFGEEIVKNEKIVIHDCDDESRLVNLGKLPSGGELIINRLAAEADLLVAEGFIEPHFFAGFSGGRKSVLPGIASRKTVIYNHNAQFIAHPCARTGIIENNPIHEDMIYAAKKAKLAFICNVIINSKKEVIYAVSGDVEGAHKAGRDFLSEQSQVEKRTADIVITSNGGFPLDQNIYQAVKGMTAAEATIKNGGVIIMAAKSNDGHGGNVFYETFKKEKNIQKLMNSFLMTSPHETKIDQWQSQIFARVLMKASIVYISDAPDEIVEDLHMIPAHSLEEAIEKADMILAQKKIYDAKILVIPDGVSVIVK